MPHPEGKELAGLARSIDALFSGGPRGAEPDVDVTPVPPDFVVESWNEAEPDPGLGSFGDEDVPADEALLVEEAVAGADDPGFSEEPDDAAVAEAGIESPTVVDAASLDLAVDAYLAGDRDQGSEIGRLAAEGLEKMDLDPSERGLLRLALAAGAAPDRDILALVETIATRPVLERMVRRMGAERDEARRAEYFSACRTIGTPIAAAIRDDLAESTDRLARRILCDAMIAMGAASRPVVEEMAGDQNRFLVRNAVRILGEVGGEGAVERVTDALWNPDARVRREALRALAKLGDAEAGQVAVGLLDDSDPEVQMAAVVTVGELRTERALRPLTAMLDAEKDPDRCVLLLHSLGQLGDPGAVPSIEKHAVPSLFSKPRADVRVAAYRALNQIGTPHARRLLNQAVSDKDDDVKAAVRELLGMR